MQTTDGDKFVVELLKSGAIDAAVRAAGMTTDKTEILDLIVLFQRWASEADKYQGPAIESLHTLCEAAAKTLFAALKAIEAQRRACRGAVLHA